MRSSRVVVTVLLALSLGACHGQGNSAAAAAIFTGLAGVGSAVSRANGQCYAVCTTGTACNQVTGLCDPLPCRGACAGGERCDVQTNKCLAMPAPALAAEANKPVRRRPVLP